MSFPKPRYSASPPAVWTEGECRALISAYRDRLKSNPKSPTAVWDSVASAVARQFPLSSPPKTAKQCSHKMKALRDRYRIEKNKEKERASLCHGRYLSSWEIFQPMFDLECDFPASFQVRDSEARIREQFGDGYRVRVDHTYRFLAGFDGNVGDPDQETPKGGDFGGGFRVNCQDKSRVLAGFHQNVGDPDQKTQKGVELGGGFQVKCVGNGMVLAGSDQNVIFPDQETRKGVEFGDGFRVQESVGGKCGENSSYIAASRRYAGEVGDVVYYGFPVKLSENRSLGLLDCKTNSSNGKNNEEFNAKLHSKRDCSYADGKRSRAYQKLQGGLDTNDAELDPIEEMASCVEFLGQVFMKMEKKKIEMARQIVKTSMEMELQQSQAIMEAQNQMLNALLESKTKKKINVESLDS